MSAAPPVIEIEDVWFSYNGSPALTGVSLTVGERDFLAVVGPNGGGKSTLLRLILGLLTPDRGRVRVFGMEPRQAARRVGYIPQDTTHVGDFPVSVRDVVLMGRLGASPRMRGWTTADRDTADRSINAVGMSGHEDAELGELSGGQRRRVFIARALAADPSMLVLDEPTAGIDPEGQLLIYDLLRDLSRRVTVVAVNHDLTALLGYARSIAHVNRTLHVHHDLTTLDRGLRDTLMASPLGRMCPVELLARIQGVAPPEPGGHDHG